MLNPLEAQAVRWQERSAVAYQYMFSALEAWLECESKLIRDLAAPEITRRQDMVESYSRNISYYRDYPNWS